MKYMVAAGSRSGSEFSIRLLAALTGEKLAPMAKVHSARQSQGDLEPAYRAFKQRGAVADFVTCHKVRTLKLEDPGVDNDAYELFEAFPGAIVIATSRPVEKIVNSHGNIKPWGMPPERVIRNWIANLEFYETAAAADRLVMIPLEDKTGFGAAAAAARLTGGAPAAGWDAFWDDWPCINDLKTQKQISNDDSEIGFSMSRADVMDRFPAVEAAAERYRKLIRDCN